ncbi:metal ABC transporter permease [Effusibacillus consociatus]|uniref:Metal ABC transporter permease n=1 Tax=Effusibacillus consociatus TaxID=1117041 RepID=A0ABV9Q4M9_9BACL
MLEIFEFDFMVRAILAGILTAIICPLIGSFLLVRRLSLVADTLAHASLAGVAAGMLFGLYPILTAMLFAFSGAFFIERLRKAYATFGEISIAVVHSTGLAIAVILFGLGKGFNVDVLSYLFGSIVAVTERDLWMISGVTAGTIVLVAAFYKKLFALSFDEEHVQLRGVNVYMLNLLFMLMTALIVSVAIRIVGVLLVSSLIVIPVAAGMQVANSFRNLLFVATGIALTGILTGLGSSYYLDLAPGGTIVLVLLAFLLGAIVFKNMAGNRF